MAYHVDPANGDLVIDGFQNGIGDSPYSGLTDARNVNLVSIPGEASVNFSTSNIASGAISGTITSASGTIATFTGGTGLENYIAVYFTSVGSFSGMSVATPYWIGNLSGSTFVLYSDYKQTTTVTPGAGATATFVSFQMATTPSFVGSPTLNGATGLRGIQRFAAPTNIQQSGYYTFGVDSLGMVWGNQFTTGTNNYWTYTGNTIVDGSNNSNASGNGLAYWKVSNGDVGTSNFWADYLFVIRNSQIDYLIVQQSGTGRTTGVWTYGWNPSIPASGATAYLTTGAGQAASHDAIVSYDGRVYFCDGPNIWKLYQTAPTTLFDPTSISTFTYTKFTLLPIDDVAQCLAPIGSNIVIGAQGNLAYMWNTTSNLISNYIPIAEPFVSRMIGVNTSVYIFAGNRGRIYITNGSQAQLWKKIPDHVSGTVEPKYQWGGVAAVKNQLYFSFSAMTNAEATLSFCGGVWAADLDSGALRITNQMSYGTYAGYASALIAQIYSPVAPLNRPSGTGLYIGWFDGVSICGVDQPSTNPYSAGQAYIISDMIPIGTLLKPTTASQVEFKLASPLLANESVQLLMASSLANGTNPTFTSAGTLTGTGTELSGNFPVSVQNQQWLLLKAILSTSTIATPSYTRLTQLRIIGGTIKQTGMFNPQ